MRASGGISTDDVPSDHGFLNFQAQGEISPGKKTRLSSHNRRIYAISLWS
jgi:hypothetical protein